MFGVLNIDKPVDMTSHDVVDYVRKLTGERRVGHGGTLDPFATGVLVVAIGKATRLLEYTRALRKTYHAVCMLGATSDTDDRTGKISKFKAQHTKQIPKLNIQTILKQFTGEIEQTPPAYSAVKIQGKKMYELARSGTQVDAKSRHVTVYDIKLLHYKYPELELEITCGSGTYIRAIARDLGKNLGTGGYAKSLRRLAIGDFTAEDAVPLTGLVATNMATHLLPPEGLVSHLPHITLTESQLHGFQQGKQIASIQPSQSTKQPTAIFDEAKNLVGTGIFTDGHLQPKKVLIP